MQRNPLISRGASCNHFLSDWKLDITHLCAGVLAPARRVSVLAGAAGFASLQLQLACILERKGGCTHFSAAAAEHGCCAAAAASRRQELRLMTDVAESCAPFSLQLHHAHLQLRLQLHLLPLPLPLTDTDSTTVLDAHVFSPLHESGASCPLPGTKSSVSNKRKCCTWRIRYSQQLVRGSQGRISRQIILI